MPISSQKRSASGFSVKNESGPASTRYSPRSPPRSVAMTPPGRGPLSQTTRSSSGASRAMRSAAASPAIPAPTMTIRGDETGPAPRGGSVPDESVESFVTRRLGREVFDRAAEPMIGTIYTADAAALSLAATMPRFLDLERRHGSVIRGLRRARTAVPEAARGPATSGPGVVDRRLGVFATAADGMQALVEAAVGRLPAGVLRLRTSATRS